MEYPIIFSHKCDNMLMSACILGIFNINDDFIYRWLPAIRLLYINRWLTYTDSVCSRVAIFFCQAHYSSQKHVRMTAHPLPESMKYTVSAMFCVHHSRLLSPSTIPLTIEPVRKRFNDVYIEDTVWCLEVQADDQKVIEISQKTQNEMEWKRLRPRVSIR